MPSLNTLSPFQSCSLQGTIKSFMVSLNLSSLFQLCSLQGITNYKCWVMSFIIVSITLAPGDYTELHIINGESLIQHLNQPLLMAPLHCPHCFPRLLSLCTLRDPSPCIRHFACHFWTWLMQMTIETEDFVSKHLQSILHICRCMSGGLSGDTKVVVNVDMNWLIDINQSRLVCDMWERAVWACATENDLKDCESYKLNGSHYLCV